MIGCVYVLTYEYIRIHNAIVIQVSRDTFEATEKWAIGRQ